MLIQANKISATVPQEKHMQCDVDVIFNNLKYQYLKRSVCNYISRGVFSIGVRGVSWQATTNYAMSLLKPPLSHLHFQRFLLRIRSGISEDRNSDTAYSEQGIW